MIEVEKKFNFTESDTARLIKGAEFLGEKVFTDTYYDTDNFSLTSKDKWLRSRGNKFELKLPIDERRHESADLYNEIDDENEIRRILNISTGEILTKELEKNGYKPFSVCKTTRKKYKKGIFNIDLDYVEYKEFNYTLGEIELLVNEKPEIDDAIKRIMDFAKENKLTITPVRGKVIEYLKRVKPDHYKVLVKSGVVRDF